MLGIQLSVVLSFLFFLLRQALLLLSWENLSNSPTHLLATYP